MSRRIPLPWAVAGSVALGTLGYAVGIEPYAVETVRIDIFLPRLPRSFDGYTICQLSDLHMTRLGRRERTLQSLMASLPTPDLIAATGDLVHTPRGIPAFLELAQTFRSHDGMCAIFGNSEHKNGVKPHAFADALSSQGIVPLLNRHILLRRGAEEMVLAGVDDPVNDRDRLSDALSGAPADAAILLLMHSPDGIAEAVARGVDLVLSGHTHGGQVRLPGLGALHTHTLLGRRMSSGYFAGKRLRHIIGIRPGRTQLYVTRGLGISGLALRFLAPPEVTCITLRRGAPCLKYAGG